MNFYNTFARRQNLGMVATFLGVIGAIFFWWTPVGIILSLAGLTVGLVGLVRINREAGGPSWVAAGVVLSLAALIFDVVVALYNAEVIHFVSYY